MTPWPAGLFRYLGIGIFSLGLFLSPFASAEDASALRIGLSRINRTDIKRHVMTLASDALEGREAGARGGKAAAAYLRSELKLLRESGLLPREETQEFGREYQNLLVLLPGSDEHLKHEVIVVGAHYDHVGYGNSTNSQGPFGQIHNGADDNASGTSALLELIKAFSTDETQPPRSILFAFWDAEEAGLLGSKYWVAHPTIPLEEIRFAINIDMLGRLREGRVTTVGWRSAPGLRSILASNNVNNELRLIFQPRVNADSDHFPFYASRIPIIHLDTDKHDDYHRPSDDPDKINWDGLMQITEFAYRVVSEIANRRELPAFRQEAFKEPTPSWMTTRTATPAPMRFGVTWDAEFAKKNIARVAHINPDSPAASAGIRIGDRIIQLGPWENGSFDDLKTILQIVKNPVPIRLTHSGGNTPVEVTAAFRDTPIRLGAGWIEDPVLPNSAIITHVVADSPADRAGIAAGDIVLELGNRPIASTEEMRQRVLEEPGPLHFRIERQGRIREVIVELFDQTKPKSIP